MVIFYSLCLLVIYLVTVTRRTADARLWLFLSLNFGLERLVIKVHRLQGCSWLCSDGAGERS